MRSDVCEEMAFWLRLFAVGGEEIEKVLRTRMTALLSIWMKRSCLSTSSMSIASKRKASARKRQSQRSIQSDRGGSRVPVSPPIYRNDVASLTPLPRSAAHSTSNREVKRPRHKATANSQTREKGPKLGRGRPAWNDDTHIDKRSFRTRGNMTGAAHTVLPLQRGSRPWGHERSRIPQLHEAPSKTAVDIRAKTLHLLRRNSPTSRQRFASDSLRLHSKTAFFPSASSHRARLRMPRSLNSNAPSSRAKPTHTAASIPVNDSGCSQVCTAAILAAVEDFCSALYEEELRNVFDAPATPSIARSRCA